MRVQSWGGGFAADSGLLRVRTQFACTLLLSDPLVLSDLHAPIPYEHLASQLLETA